MADTQAKTQDPATGVATTDSKVIALGALERAEVEQTFAEAKDFRSIGEKITAPLDSIISETAKIIDKDPIMNVNEELQTMNTSVQAVYKEIIDNDGTMMKIAKSIPLISSLAKTLDAKWDEASFNVKSLEGKIQVIFSGFDQAYTSLNTSIDMQKSFLDGIEGNIGKVVAYKEFLAEKIVEFKAKGELATTEDEKMKYDMFLRNVEFFQSNLVVLIGNLELARKRLLIRLDSAAKLSLAMNSSRPIFKTLLSTALIETSSQKALEASIKAIGVMGATIDKMSSGLTDKAIESSRKAEEMSSKPVLSTSVFIENVTKLKNHFEEIDAYRAQVKIAADKDQLLFAEAKTNLDGIKTISRASQEELATQLSA
ncbi:MAG: hypothetical protein WC774_02610 [Candidatus Gracilibacteria bacterium]|jgi:hypothetical protein